MKILPTLALFTSKINATGNLIWIGAVFGIVINFIFGTQTMAWIFVCLLMLDFLTGMMASLKRGEYITSRRMRDMWFKWITYLVILLVGACLDLVTGTIWIHAAAFGWIILSEGVSILENCEQVLGKSIPFLGRIKKVVDVMRGNGEEK